MIPAFNYAGAPVPPPTAMPMAVPMAAPMPPPPPAPAHRGTLPPGTKVVVGKHMVVVQRYLAEGGFAHVYLVASRDPIPIPAVDSHGNKTMRPETTHVLKRMAVPDKQTLALVRGEVEAHRLLHGHAHIVHFIEASATALPSGGYEVFILMEYCSGGGIIDLMNKRLRDRLREGEVLKIFGDVCEGLAVMHHLDPPLMHRDLKIENVLIRPPPADDLTLGPVYKLADFGSASPVLSRRAPKSMEEIKRVEADLNRATTMQYRAPEMVDVYQRRVIDEKADIWAMGVFLYKLCYYTTPFEENGGGPVAILNARYRFPPSPVYSQNLKNLIASMLQENAASRPTIDQLIVRVYELRGLAAPTTATHYARLTHEGKQLTPLPNVVSRERTVRRASAQPSSLDDSVVNVHPVHRPKPDHTAGEARSGSGRLVQIDTDDTMREEDLIALRRSVRPDRSPAPAHANVDAGAAWSGPRKSRPYSTIGTESRSPAGRHTSFEPFGSHLSAPSGPRVGMRSPSPGASARASPVSPSFIDDAPARYPSLDEPSSVLPQPHRSAEGSIAAKAKQFQQPTYAGQTLAYQPRQKSKPRVARKSAVLDRWPPANTNTNSSAQTGGSTIADALEESARAEAIEKARAKLAARPTEPAPALPHRSPRPSPRPAPRPASSIDASSEPPAEPAPAQDWLTGSEDLLVDMAASPIPTDQEPPEIVTAAQSPPKPLVPKPKPKPNAKPGRLSRIWPDAGAGAGASPPAPSGLPPPTRRSPAAATAVGNGDVSTANTTVPDKKAAPGKLKPPAWVLQQQKSASEPARAVSRPSSSPSLSPSTSFVVSPALPPRQESMDRSSATDTPDVQSAGGVEFVPTATGRVKAPDWDEPDMSAEMGRLAPPLAPSPSPHSPRLRANSLGGGGALSPSPPPHEVPSVVLSPTPTADVRSPAALISPTSPGAAAGPSAPSPSAPMSGFGKNRLSHLINAANERESRRSEPSLLATSTPSHATPARSRSTGVIQPPHTVANDSVSSDTTRSSPASPPAPAPRSLAQRMRDLEISKAEAAAKRQSQVPAHVPPVRATTLPQPRADTDANDLPHASAASTVHSEPSSERTSVSDALASASAAVRPKPRVSAKPASLRPTPPMQRLSPKPTTPWEREAAEAEAEAEAAARGVKEQGQGDAQSIQPNEFQGVNTLISRWQGGQT